MFGRKKIKALELSKEKLLNAIARYRNQQHGLFKQLEKAEELNGYYRGRNKELRTELYELKKRS